MINYRGAGYISEDEFWDEWGVYKHESEDLFCFEHIKDKPTNFVWTIVESGIGDDDTWYASPGVHYVNRLGYVMTKKPWTDDMLDAIYFASEFDLE